jgi:hypothetical protein
MKKVQVNYRIDDDVAQMLNTIATEENRSLNNTVETLIKEYYKKTRRFGEMENLSNDELKKIACKEYNKMARDLEYNLTEQTDFKVIKETLNVEFRKRAYHIDNGKYSLRSGIESKHWVESIKTSDQYLITKIKFNDIFSDAKKKKDEIINIDYLV